MLAGAGPGRSIGAPGAIWVRAAVSLGSQAQAILPPQVAAHPSQGSTAAAGLSTQPDSPGPALILAPDPCPDPGPRHVQQEGWAVQQLLAGAAGR